MKIKIYSIAYAVVKIRKLSRFDALSEEEEEEKEKSNTKNELTNTILI